MSILEDITTVGFGIVAEVGYEGTAFIVAKEELTANLVVSGTPVAPRPSHHSVSMRDTRFDA
jgi:hypothetical protein